MRLVNLLISQAITDHASDIHVEPTGKDVRIRYRIDGVLHEVMRSPRNIQNGMISRLKVMADINIAERRIPQDGRISTTIDGRPVDLRVATLPTVNGEKVVMRILDKNQAELRLSELGFLPNNMQRYEVSYTKPYGTVLVTGPTGSGKTTTLYATLNILNQAFQERHHRRGPGRVPARRHKPDPGQQQGGAHLCVCAADDPAGGPRHHPRRGNKGPRDGRRSPSRPP